MCNKLDFIIFATPRSGSNHLVSLLDSHPKLTCYGEIFRPLYLASKRIDTNLEYWNSPQKRQSMPERFLKEVKAIQSRPTEGFGFKLFPNHAQMLPFNILQKVDKVIYLERENLLARYSSMLTAKATGQGALKVHQKAQRTKVTFVAGNFEKFVRNKNAEKKYMNQLISESPEDKVFRLNYRDINNSAIQQDLLKFLLPELSENQELVSILAKRNPSSIVDRFSNKEDVEVYFDQNPSQRHWVNE